MLLSEAHWGSEMAWPALREDLQLYPAEATDKGLPQWTLHDPLRNLFFRLDWRAVEILSRWSLGDPARIIGSIAEETTFSTSLSEIEALGQFLAKNQLAHSMGEGGTKALIALSHKSHKSLITQLAHKYLFFRVPIFKPDRFLSATVRYVEPFFSRSFMILTLIALVVGLFLTLRQASDFGTGLMSLWSLDSLLKLAVSYGFVKVIHELAHAYTAKRQGVRIPVIGVAFLVLIPMPYTDTSESWKLRKDSRRLNIAAAGIVSELALAAWATLFWALLPDGGLRDAALMMATTTWVSSLIINLSPFMRFDGYFILMDFLKMPNLHQRAGALAVWRMREWLFGLSEPIPEVLPKSRHRLVIAFAYASWIYRLIVFLGIALLVYHFFIKAIGIALFAIEIWWFVLKPVVREVGVWIKMRDKIAINRKTVRTLTIVGVIWAVVFVPWRSHVALPAVASPGEYAVIYSPVAGELVSLNAERGTVFKEGAVIGEINSRDLAYRFSAIEKRIMLVSAILQRSSLSSDTVDQRLSSTEELRRLTSERHSIDSKLSQQIILAPFEGVVDERISDIQVGMTIAEGEALLGLRSMGQGQVTVYATEDELARLTEKGLADFIPSYDPMLKLSLGSGSVQTLPLDTLEHPQLGSVFGGPIRAQLIQDKVVPTGGIYKIVYGLPEGKNTFNQTEVTGVVIAEGRAESLAARYSRKVISVLMRELSF